VRFNDDLEIKPARLIRRPPPISFADYERISGPSWPSYEDFCASNIHPKWLKDEIRTMTGMSL
jgi:hypothetical protein